MQERSWYQPRWISREPALLLGERIDAFENLCHRREAGGDVLVAETAEDEPVSNLVDNALIVGTLEPFAKRGRAPSESRERDVGTAAEVLAR